VSIRRLETLSCDLRRAPCCSGGPQAESWFANDNRRMEVIHLSVESAAASSQACAGAHSFSGDGSGTFNTQS
jgi:hypothetical protein